MVVAVLCCVQLTERNRISEHDFSLIVSNFNSNRVQTSVILSIRTLPSFPRTTTECIEIQTHRPVINHSVFCFESFRITVMSTKPNANSNSNTDHKERKKKESIVDLSRYLEKVIRVKFAGGREVSGILKGYDPLVNLVLDNTTEYLRDSEDPFKLTNETRQLGLVVCRGTAVILVCPMDSMESIPNPFISHD